ncbi:MAG: zf-HC2 domain-containing protein [Cyanobacteria bacterium]|nr:zf-HC2 domain-containing protein [Cyanobacteriota bacterium]
MVTCANYQEDLSALLDDELKANEKTDLETHLTECKDCASRFESLKQLNSFMTQESFGGLVVPDIWASIKEAGKLPSVCDVIDEDLSAYLDGELPPAAQDGVKQHLADCTVCLEKFKRLNTTNQLLSKGLVLPDSIEIDLWSSVKNRLTKDCDVIETELSSFLDQEVVANRHRAITTHIMDCLPCREKFEAMSQVGEALREHYKPVIPEDLDLWPEIKNKMRVVPFKPREQKPEKREQKPKRARPRLSVVAAAAVAILGFGSIALWLSAPDDSDFPKISAESYLIESSFEEPSNAVEAVVYDQ